jgi:tetratricopeptide (TPR) repeat protein
VLGSNEIEYDWDFAGGEAEIKRALELDPNDATAHQWYGWDLGLIGGREQEALAEINRAHQLDPLSLIIGYDVGIIHLFARRYDEAIAVCKKLASENPTYAPAHACLADAYVGKRMYPQVIEEYKMVVQLSEEPSRAEFESVLIQGYGSGSWKGALTKGLEFSQGQRKTKPSSENGSPYYIAALYAELGDKDHAFQWFNTAYQEHDTHLLSLNTDYTLDPVRSDPRFSELVRKVGLPQ